MSADSQSAAADLAFLRALVTGGDDGQRQFGEAYFAAGICYGIQLLLHGAQGLGVISGPPIAGFVIGFAPSVVFAALLTWIIVRNRRHTPLGAAGRGVRAVFGSIGLANLALIVVIGSVALREKSFTIWLIYPCTVFVLQGAGWLASFGLRRKAWLAWVAAGWFVSAVGMAWFITQMPQFILCAGFGILVCMALPGWVIMRQSRKAA